MFKSFEHFGLHTPQIESPAQTSRKDVDKRSKKGWHTITSNNQSDNFEREVITPCTEKSVGVKLEKAIWDIFPMKLLEKLLATYTYAKRIGIHGLLAFNLCQG